MILGEGFRETIGDRERQQHCLEECIKIARQEFNVQDLAYAATAWAKHIDALFGATLIHEAEAMAKNKPKSVWSVANAWRETGDFQAAERVILSALTNVKNADEALYLAKAAASHDNARVSEMCVEEAERLSKSADELLALAEFSFDSGVGDMRRFLDRALSISRNSEERERVSQGYRLWQKDEECASKIAPSGFRPEWFRRSVKSQPEFQSSASELFDWLRSVVTADTLELIAGADYGVAAEKHFLALQQICKDGLLPRQLDWHPREVLELTRWSRGENVNHYARALCCAILMITGGDEEELVKSGCVLIESSIQLGEEAVSKTSAFFAWIAQSVFIEDASEYDEEYEIDDRQQAQHAIATFSLLLLCLSAMKIEGMAPRTLLVLHSTEEQIVELSRLIYSSINSHVWKDLAQQLIPAEYPRFVGLREILEL